MDLKKLQYFLVVAEEGNITRAAKRLHIAQPPLSHQIRLLEDELGVPLLEKVGRQIRITKIGQTLRDRSEQILDLVDKTIKELRDLHDGSQGTLSIGSVAAWGATLLPERIKDFHKCFPAIKFQIWEGNASRIQELLNSGVIDIGIIPKQYASSDLYDSMHLPSESVVAVMSAAWGDKLPADCISLLDLADKPLILNRSRNRRALENYFHQHKMEPNILCVHDDVRSILMLANAGIGVALVPKIAVHLMQNTNLIYKEITAPPLLLEGAIIWMKNRYLSSAARSFLTTLSGKADAT
ncbi:MAG: LysR family transcriptional regulator [Negativicutes bacterium]|nr:LysR family transcriptional regulator [Negativicutes bacterium]